MTLAVVGGSAACTATAGAAGAHREAAAAAPVQTRATASTEADADALQQYDLASWLPTVGFPLGNAMTPAQWRAGGITSPALIGAVQYGWDASYGGPVAVVTLVYQDGSSDLAVGWSGRRPVDLGIVSIPEYAEVDGSAVALCITTWESVAPASFPGGVLTLAVPEGDGCDSGWASLAYLWDGRAFAAVGEPAPAMAPTDPSPFTATFDGSRPGVGYGDGAQCPRLSSAPDGELACVSDAGIVGVVSADGVVSQPMSPCGDIDAYDDGIVAAGAVESAAATGAAVNYSMLALANPPQALATGGEYRQCPVPAAEAGTPVSDPLEIGACFVTGAIVTASWWASAAGDYYADVLDYDGAPPASAFCTATPAEQELLVPAAEPGAPAPPQPPCSGADTSLDAEISGDFGHPVDLPEDVEVFPRGEGDLSFSGEIESESVCSEGVDPSGAGVGGSVDLDGGDLGLDADVEGPEAANVGPYKFRLWNLSWTMPQATGVPPGQQLIASLEDPSVGLKVQPGVSFDLASGEPTLTVAEAKLAFATLADTLYQDGAKVMESSLTPALIVSVEAKPGEVKSDIEEDMEDGQSEKTAVDEETDTLSADAETGLESLGETFPSVEAAEAPAALAAEVQTAVSDGLAGDAAALDGLASEASAAATAADAGAGTADAAGDAGVLGDLLDDTFDIVEIMLL